jgi:hypothetical protein
LTSKIDHLGAGRPMVVLAPVGQANDAPLFERQFDQLSVDRPGARSPAHSTAAGARR